MVKKPEKKQGAGLHPKCREFEPLSAHENASFQLAFFLFFQGYKTEVKELTVQLFV